jgi:hypothetical protein
MSRTDTDLLETMHALDARQEEQARTATALLEREVWAATLLIEASKPIWAYLGSPTLRFMPARATDYHLELGYYRHLAALSDRSPDEQLLLQAALPTWARVYTHRDRCQAGFSGALGQSYVTIPVREAVIEAGFSTILAQLEAAMLAQAREQRDRQERLQQVERMLGWEQDPEDEAVDRPLSLGTHLLLTLLKEGTHNWLALTTGFISLVVLVLCLPLGVPSVLIAVMAAGAGALLWRHCSAP